MVTTRPWVEDLLHRLFGTRRRSALHEELVDDVDPDVDIAQLLDLGITEQQLRDAMQALRSDRKDLLHDIRRDARKYQALIDRARNATGIAREDAKIDAKQRKTAAEEKRREYFLLGRKAIALNRVWSKLQRLKRRRTRRHSYDGALDDLEAAGVRTITERVGDTEFDDTELLDEIEHEFALLDEDVAPDLSDVEQDIGERDLQEVEAGMTGEFGEDITTPQPDEEELPFEEER